MATTPPMTSMTSQGRRLFTGTDTSGELPVEYRFRPARNGNRHLVVVFANFDAPQDYGWSNGVLDNLRANVLWIRDRFDGHNSYYLCGNGDFAVERSVLATVDRFLDALGLTRDGCTLLGSSKGASAALHYGLAYGFKNIVAAAPQFSIGTYVREVHPRTARAMMGDDFGEGDVRELDARLPDLVGAELHRGANIYLLSSPADAQYASQIRPHLLHFDGYDNFNFIFTDSPFVPDHTRVAGRNVPVIIGILNLLIDGIAPRIGFVRNGYEDPAADRTALDAHLEATAAPGTWVSPPVVTTLASGETVNFMGTAREAVTVQFWENGRYVGKTGVGADGTWAWKRDTAWPTGRHTLRTFATNAHGVESERTTVTFTTEAVDAHV
ncbi:Ig-like domain-containing protein [Streptomyces sp. UC4497]